VPKCENFIAEFLRQAKDIKILPESGEKYRIFLSLGLIFGNLLLKILLMFAHAQSTLTKDLFYFEAENNGLGLKIFFTTSV
jgi:hypothetical protein